LKIQNKRPFFILLIAVFLLLIPLIAMQFTAEVKWTLGDFIVAAILIASTELGVRLLLSSRTFTIVSR
jgi:hypothetical protein